MAPKKRRKQKNEIGHSLQSASGHGIAQAFGEHASAIANIGYSAEQISTILRSAGGAQQAVIDSLSCKLNATGEAIRGFFQILGASDVPVEKLPEKLAEIAQQHTNMLLRLSSLLSTAQYSDSL
jgi:ABC-type transporter Mla subunit MlaD